MDITTDYDYRNGIGSLPSQQEVQRGSALRAVTEAAQAVQDAGADEDTSKAVFAEALRAALDDMEQEHDLGSVLSGSSVFGNMSNYYDISEMMKSESGRQAINALADNALTSVVFGREDDSDQDSVLNTLIKGDHSTEQRLEDALRDVLEVLESSGGSTQAKEEA